MKLDLRQLRHLLALDRHRNFARAAEAIALTQSALSRSIQALEGQIGARLFDRNQSRVEPTAVGIRLVELARPLVSQAMSVEAELEQMVGLVTGLVRIGAGPFAAEISVGAAVGRLVREHPGVRVEISVEEWHVIFRRLLANEVDVAVIETSDATGDDWVIIEPLPQHMAVFYCRAGHPLVGRLELTMDDINRFPIAMTTVPKRLHDLIGTGEFTPNGELPQGAANTEIRVTTSYVARQVVMESDAIGVALPRQIRREVASGDLVMLPLELSRLRTAYGIMRLAWRTPSPATLEFVRLLREVESGIEGHVTDSLLHE